MSPGVLTQADDLLRGRLIGAELGSSSLLRLMLLFVVAFGLLYGAMMGTFAGHTGIRLQQMLYSGLKVPLLLLVTFALSFPCFFVLNTLMGVRDDFAEVVRALLATQAALTMILGSVCPLTILWYASFADYSAAIAFNGLMFFIASVGAQIVLARAYRPLIARNPSHRILFRTWVVIYAFVGIQMGWTLRPFIGNPDAPTQFFRAGAFGNAYVETARIIIHAFGG